MAMVDHCSWQQGTDTVNLDYLVTTTKYSAYIRIFILQSHSFSKTENKRRKIVLHLGATFLRFDLHKTDVLA